MSFNRHLFDGTSGNYRLFEHLWTMVWRRPAPSCMTGWSFSQPNTMTTISSLNLQSPALSISWMWHSQDAPNYKPCPGTSLHFFGAHCWEPTMKECILTTEYIFNAYSGTCLVEYPTWLHLKLIRLVSTFVKWNEHVHFRVDLNLSSLNCSMQIFI
jgi:hypothetical protein